MDSFNAIFQHAHIGIIIANTSGDIELANSFANTIFGYAEGELFGKKIEILIPESIRPSHVVDREEYAKKPTPRSMGAGRDLSALRKCGEIFPVEISLCSYEINKDKKIVSFINDISARKKSEKELTQLTLDLEEKVEERTVELSQALVELSITNENLKKREDEVQRALENEIEINEMKSRFVSMASHEFRTPLAGILSSATLLGKYQGSGDAPKREKHITRIKKSVKNLTSILTDFLSLDKLEEGVIKANPTVFQLHDLIEEIIGDSQELLEGQTFKYEVESPHSLSLFQDVDMLRNVFINLISNSIKYSKAETTILIKTQLISDDVIISISDQGIGIPEDEQKHLFSRFFRAGNAINLNGTGLGLNIVKRYIDLLKGDITFVSKLNVGSTFTIILPTRREL
jgi:PAS domain S-box-containing protein